MKRTIKGLALMMAMVMMFTGCASEEAAKEFNVSGFGINLTATESWEESADTPFDIQITNGKCYVSVMAYKTADVEAYYTPLEIYDWHNEDIFSRRDDMEIVEELTTYAGTGKTITKTLYSAVNEDVENHYLSCLVTFDDNPDVFAWVLVSTMPSYMEDNEEALLEIIDSMQADGE